MDQPQRLGEKPRALLTKRKAYSQGYYMLTSIVAAFGLSGNEFLVFSTIHRDITCFGHCMATNHQIEKRCGLCKDTVLSALRRLKALQLITSRTYYKPSTSAVNRTLAVTDKVGKNFRTHRRIRINNKLIWSKIKPKNHKKKVISDTSPIWLQFTDLAVKLIKHHTKNDHWDVRDSELLSIGKLKLDDHKWAQLDKEMRSILADPQARKMALGES